MKKILKKSLACMLAAILCLTACVGAMASVSAEDAITYTIADVAINQGESGTIDVTVGNFANVAGLIAEITLPDAVVSIDSVKLNGTAELVKMTDETAGHYVLNGKTIKFVGLFNSLDEFGLGNVDALTINIAVTVADAASETTFAAPVFQAGTELEQILAVNGTVGKLTVKAVCKHTETKTVEENRVEADCVNDGSYDEVVYCAACDFEISRTKKTIAALGHTEETIPAVDATCTTAGATAGVKCSVCDTVITAPETVDALGHNWVDGDITYTDCTSNGNMAQNCSRCDATQTVAVDPKGHTEVSYEEVAATCTTVGYTGGKYCSECDAVIEARTEIPATGHTPAEAVEENRTEAQPGVAGSYDMVVYCSVCKAEISRTPHEIPALPEACDHADAESVVTAQPTKDTVGTKTYTCDCGETWTEDIAKPVNISTAKIQHNLSLTDRVYDRFVFSLKQISNAGYDASTNGYFVALEYNKYKATENGYMIDPKTKNLYDADKDLANSSGNGRSFFFNELALYEMTVDYTITVYVYDANGIVVAYVTDTTSIAQQALALVAGKSEVTYKNLYVCLADMMNYGQAAQDYFKKAGDDLTNAASPVEIFAQYMSHASDASTLPATLPANAAGLKKELATTSFNARGDVKIAASTIPTFMVTAGTYDVANTTIEVSYTNGYGNPVTDTVTVEPTKNSSGKWRYDFEFGKLAMYDLSSTVTVTMKYNGVTEATYEYALTSFINSNMSNANMNTILTAMSLFSRSASLQLGLTPAY